MPKRRPQDVVHTVMTDHFIRRNPAGPDFLAPRAEREPQVTRVDAGDELYALLAYVRATNGANASAVRRLEGLLVARKPEHLEPWLDLGSGQLRQRQWAALEKTALHVLERDPKQELGREWLAIARAGLTGNGDAAIQVLSDLTRPEAAFNTGVLLITSGRTAEAIPHFERALAQRPNLAAAWYRLGEAKEECGDRNGAIDAFRRALEIDPAHARANAAIVEAFLRSGNAGEAERYRTVANGR